MGIAFFILGKGKPESIRNKKLYRVIWILFHKNVFIK